MLELHALTPAHWLELVPVVVALLVVAVAVVLPDDELVAVAVAEVELELDSPMLFAMLSHSLSG